MILLTLNIKGVGGALKLSFVCRLLFNVKPDIIFLQETLVLEEKARLFMQKIVPTWYMCAVSSEGTSGGLLATWDPNKFTLEPTLCSGGIMLLGVTLDTHCVIHFLNVYGPRTDRVTFWNRLVTRGILATKILVIA
jgi:exonuclease III